MPPKSLIVAAEKLDFSIYYLCSNATDGFERGSFIYKRVSELEETISHFNKAGIPSKNIFLSGFSAGGWTALMAASILPDHFNRGVLFAPAFSGPRYESTIFPVWRKVIRPKQINEISKAKILNFLVFAYEDDPFNRPRDLGFLLNRKTSYPKIIGYNCNKGHFTYTKDCKINETSSRILTFFQESEF
jgi:pimeloyl-ACP methyl ester carboxylesterase